jgi:hypothetical protein
MQIMTILGSVLDENSLLSTYDGIARYEVSDDVSRRFILPEIKNHLDSEFDCDTSTCNLYLSLKTFEPLGFRVLNGEGGEDVFFDDMPDISYNKEKGDFLYTTICQHLGCKAIKEAAAF